MKISFAKIGRTAKPFILRCENVVLECTLKSVHGNFVLLEGNMNGSLDALCDRCGDDYNIDVDSILKLSLSDRVMIDKADLDIIEFLDEVVDLDYIFEGEINAIKSTYHYCTECEKSDEELIVEL